MELSEEEKRKLEAFIYWVETNTEIGVSTIPDYICKNVLNLIEKQQKELENSVSKDKIREKMQEYYEKANPYDCDTADYKQSQEIGGWNALRKLLEE